MNLDEIKSFIELDSDEMKFFFEMIVALIVASWAAVGTALKCRDKIDASRNLLLGLGGSDAPESQDVRWFILTRDVLGITIALILVLAAVAIILMVASLIMYGTGLSIILVLLFGISGAFYAAGAVVTAFYGAHDYWWLRGQLGIDRSRGPTGFIITRLKTLLARFRT